MYIVYTVDHRMFLFDDIEQARRFRKAGNDEGHMTWYIAEAPVMYGFNEGSEAPATRIDTVEFPK